MVDFSPKIKYCHIDFPETKSFTFDHVHIHWNEQIDLHRSPTWELSYIIKGSGTRILGDKIETFSSGEVILIPPNMPHCWKFNHFDHDLEGKIENITIIFPHTLLTGLLQSLPETKQYLEPITILKTALSFEGHTLEAIQELMFKMRLQDDFEQLQSLLCIFRKIGLTQEAQVVSSTKIKNSHDSRLEEISRYIIHNYQKKITLDEMARFTGMNRSSFCTFFKKEKGTTFFHELNTYRLQCACLQLKETDESVADIGYNVGFNDIPYFNRIFRRRYKLSPGEYRKKIKMAHAY